MEPRRMPEQWPSPLARELAKSWASLAQDRRLHGAMATACARNLRRVLAAEQRAGTAAVDDPPQLRRQRRLAAAIDDHNHGEGIAATVADLRCVARLTLGECADLLGSPRALLRAIWRPARRSIFAAARRIAGSGASIASSPSSPDQASSPGADE